MKILLLLISIFITGCASVEHNTGIDGLLNERESKIQGYLYDLQSNIELELNALGSVYYNLQLYDANIIGEQNKLKLEASKKRKQVHKILVEINRLEAKSRKYGNLRNDIGQTRRDLKLFQDPIIEKLKLTTDDLKYLSDDSSVTGKNILDPKTPSIKKLNKLNVQKSVNTRFKLNTLVQKINSLGNKKKK